MSQLIFLFGLDVNEFGYNDYKEVLEFNAKDAELVVYKLSDIARMKAYKRYITENDLGATALLSGSDYTGVVPDDLAGAWPTAAARYVRESH